MSRVVFIAGGGTGGHLFPGLAVAGALGRLDPGLKVIVVGAGKALESQAVADAGFASEKLNVRAIRGQGLTGRIAALVVLPGAIWDARGLIKRHQPGMVLAVGGYAAFPLGVAAFMCRVPLAVQEQNAVPGLTNRMLARLARVVFTSFAAAGDCFSPRKVRLMGNPVRQEILEQARAASAQRPDPAERFNLLVLGGSQGAASLNRALMGALPQLAGLGPRLFITHQSGALMAGEVHEAYAESKVQHRTAAFFNNMGELYAKAHLVICRAGAGTVTELAATGRASLLVPYPYAASDHQSANAGAMVDAGAAELVPDAELTSAKVVELVRRFMDDSAGPPALAAMEQSALSLARPQAALDIARVCLALMEGGR